MAHKDDSQEGITRRGVTLAAGALGLGATLSNVISAPKSTRMPAVFVPHGGGPWPFVDMGVPAHEVAALRSYLEDLPRQLPARPKALLVVSAHWEEEVATVMTSPAPPMLYDYGGFPPESYTLQWPAPGEPALARRVVSLLEAAGIPAQQDAQRGFDHGTFIPFKVSWPAADIPTLQLSIKSNYDPKEHLALGRALAPLRDEGVLILGSGMSFHSFRSFRMGTGAKDSAPFDAWLKQAATASPEVRTEALINWASAPGARLAHPQEDHLLPLMVVAGAAGEDLGRISFNDVFMGARLSAVHFG